MKNKYLLLISSLGTLALLVAAAWQEGFRREWRRLQAEGRTEEGAISVQLRQIVNPSLRTSDRCVSCHVAMGPGEQGVTGSKVLVAHKPVVHDPAEYGCTVCHGGQGAATDKADAHGEVEFWPQPMLPARYSYAACGACHATPGVPEKHQMQEARLAFERLDCYTCHRIEGRGGTLRPGGGGMEGGDLSRVGLTGFDSQWYPKHLAKAAAESHPAWKTFRPVEAADHARLALFLATRVGASRLVDAKAVFHSAGCLGCHKVSGVGGDDGPDLSRAGDKDPGQIDFAPVQGKHTLANWVGEHFRSPGGVTAGSQMPALGLTEDDIDKLTLYVLSLRRRDLPSTYTPKDRVRITRFGQREHASDGATIFGAYCAGCHGLDGMGRRSPGMAGFPAIASPAFHSRVTDAFLAETVAKGRPGRRMPAWGQISGGLKPEEIAKVVGHLRSLSRVAAVAESTPARWVSADAVTGGRLFAASCAGCHGRKGEGGEGVALNNKVLLGSATDTYFVETILKGRLGTAMPAFGEPSTVHRTYSRGEAEAIVAFLRSWESPLRTAGSK